MDEIDVVRLADFPVTVMPAALAQYFSAGKNGGSAEDQPALDIGSLVKLPPSGNNGGPPCTGSSVMRG